jgi:crotonobetainyl-CoA:carnitine CoA-transferase CaiB-like acyl-CoA transferase
MSEMTEPVALLSGYRVLDLSSSMGAFCGKLLRELGMDVINIDLLVASVLCLEPRLAESHVKREESCALPAERAMSAAFRWSLR